MKKLFITYCFLLPLLTQAAPPEKGGYMGKRIIVGVEGAYSPNYLTIQNFLFSYNLQYGGNFRFVCGRYHEIGVTYNRFSLGGHDRYEEFGLNESEKIQGSTIGFTVRKYRVKRGGLAPIGRYYELGLLKQTASFRYASSNAAFAEDKVTVSRLMISGAAGIQHIFYNKLVTNVGVRVGIPVFEIESSTTNIADGDPELYVTKRMLYHGVFTPYFGIGLIL